MPSNVQQFELFHGIVLTKLVRNPKQITLRMIETNVKAAWALYTINTDVLLYVKSSKKPRRSKKNRGVRIWQFTFSPDDLAKLGKQNGATHAALVCGTDKVTDKCMQVCLIEPSELAEMIDIKAAQQQWIRVTYIPAKKLRVTGTISTADCLIKRSRLDEWNVPGA